MKQEILVVDAEPRSVRVLDAALRRAGYRVRIAGSGIDAIEKIEAKTPGVVVIDSELPELDGYSVVQNVMAGLQASHVPVVALTRSSQHADRWLRLGVTEHLAKPVFVREIVGCVALVAARAARARIAAGVSASTPGMLSGSTGDLTVIDLLQGLETTRGSGVLRLVGRGQQAEIYFRDGRVVDARAGLWRGERAVYAALGWQEADFDLELKPILEEDTVALSTGALLMEGIRRLEETAFTAAATSSSDGRGSGSDPDGRRSADRAPGSGRTELDAPEHRRVAGGVRAGDDAEAPLGDVLLPVQETAVGEIDPMALGIWPDEAAADVAFFQADPVRTSFPSSRPWTREVLRSPESELDDLVEPGLPRVVTQTAKRVVVASVAVAALICVTAAFRTVSLRRDRMADDSRRNRAAVASIAQSQLAAPPALAVARARAAAPASALGPATLATGSHPAGPIDVQRPAETAAAAPRSEPGATAAVPERAPALMAQSPGPGAAGEAQAKPPDPGLEAKSPSALAAAPAVARVPPGGPAPSAQSGPLASAQMATVGQGELVRQAEKALLQGAPERALLLATQAVSVLPSDAAGWLVLASAHKALGQEDAARSDYRNCAIHALTEGVNDCRILSQN